MYNNINKCSTLPVFRWYCHLVLAQYWSSTCSQYCASTVNHGVIMSRFRQYYAGIVYSTAPVLFSTTSTGARSTAPVVNFHLDKSIP